MVIRTRQSARPRYPVAQFENNFHQLLTLGTKGPAIWAAANKYEFRPIEARSHLNYNPSGVYASMPTTGTAVTIPIPGYGNLPIPPISCPTRTGH